MKLALAVFIVTLGFVGILQAQDTDEDLEVPAAVREAVTRDYGDAFEVKWHARTDDSGTHYFAEWETPEATIWLELNEDGEIVNRRISEADLKSETSSPEAEQPSLDGVLYDGALLEDPDALPESRNEPDASEIDESLIDDVSPAPPSLDGVLDDRRGPIE